jgi:hypothetical protein
LTQRSIILALDFDGVMHPVNTGTESKFCHLDLLEAWLRGRPSVRVLISSSWREEHPLDELVSFFSEDLQRRIAGVTPVYEKVIGQQWVCSNEDVATTQYRRQVEIERWIADSGATVETWVALDDEPSLFAPRCPNLVVCDPRVGLTERHLAMLDGLLFDGVWEGDPGIKARLDRLEQDVRDGLRIPESLSVFTREQVQAMTIIPQPELPGPMYDWGEQEERLEAADMVSVEEASALSGVPAAVLKRWAVSGRVLGLEHGEAEMRFPKWQFDQPLRDAIPELFKALGTKDPWVVLHWLETPLESLAGRTPRAAIEQGDLPRALAMARFDG